jgi:hypothetical protein
MMKSMAFCLLATLLCSCASPHGSTAWVNIHRRNPDLVGVWVQQLPDCAGDHDRYVGRHPAMIIFVFKNNKAHQVEYDPDGRVTSGFWWDIPPDHFIWSQLDRNVPRD